MGRKQEKELERLENHLAAADACQVDSAVVYNRDSADVDLEKYSRRVRGGSKAGCIVWAVIVLILAVLAVFLYQILQGGSGYGS